MFHVYFNLYLLFRVVLMSIIFNDFYYYILTNTNSRLPEIRSFIKGGEAEWYRNVHINIVRGKHTTLHVFNTTSTEPLRVEEIAQIPLTSFRTKDEIHKIMKQYGFTMKSMQERQEMLDRANRIRDQKNYAMFFRKEYLRLQFYHAYYFRQDVMNDMIYYNNMTWTNTPHDYLWKNYDNIFRHEVIKGKQIHEYATKYLVRVGRIQPNEL